MLARLHFLLALWLCLSCSSNVAVVGIVVDGDGNPLGDRLISLISIDNSGTTNAQIKQAVTNSNGAFSLGEFSPLDGRFLVEAILTDGSTIRAFAAGSGTGITVSPLRQALVNALLEITSGGGQNLENFDLDELRQFDEQLEDVNLEGIDTSVESALIEAIFAELATAIIAALDNTLAAQPLATFGAPNLVTSGPNFEAAIVSDPCQVDHTELMNSGFNIDIVANGSICDGNNLFQNDAFRDRGVQLSVPEETFPGNDIIVGSAGNTFPAVASINLEDDRELVFGPVTTNSGNLRVTRKVFVPEDGNYFRHLDIFENLATTTQTITIIINNCLGSEVETVLLTTSTKDQTLSTADHYSITFEDLQLDPTVLLHWQSPNASETVDAITLDLTGGTLCNGQLSYRFEEIELPAGALKTFMYFGILSTSRELSTLIGLIDTLVAEPPIDGLSANELLNLQNISPKAGNLTGGAGSVIPNSLVTITNETQDISKTKRAESDGSLFAFIEADVDDEIVVTASGVSRNVTVAEP